MADWLDELQNARRAIVDISLDLDAMAGACYTLGLDRLGSYLDVARDELVHIADHVSNGASSAVNEIYDASTTHFASVLSSVLYIVDEKKEGTVECRFLLC